jgi:hypothetical protein
MKSLPEVFIGALVFIAIDRMSKVVASSVIDNNKRDRIEVEKITLRVELLTLFVTLFIGIQFIKF